MGQDPCKNVYTESAWKERDSWQKADAILAQLNLKPGDQVADIGCHEGYMSVKLSTLVGTDGKVYAVDVESSRLDKLREHLKSRQITNVVPVLGDRDDPKIPTNSFQAVLIIDSYHEMKDHDKILQKIKAALRSGGRLVICEAIAESRRNLDREQQEGKHELGMSYAIDDLRKAGFQILLQRDRFVDREKIKGDKMWLVVATKL